MVLRTFSACVSYAYDEANHWRRNLFSVPVGWAGTQFIHELACLFQSCADGLALECVALKTTMLQCYKTTIFNQSHMVYITPYHATGY